MKEAFPWLGFIFWLGLFSWFGIRVWSRFLIEQERQKTLRAFAERGTPLDKEMMEKLYPAVAWAQSPIMQPPSSETTARGLVVAGIVCGFLGLGLIIGAQLIGRIEPEALLGMSTAGIIVSCLGLGLMTASWALRRMRARDRDRASAEGEDIR
jgi:hypothetical protein